MNAVSNSVNDFMEENAGGSDSDTNTDDLPEYYQPISAGVGDDDGDLSDQENSDRSSEEGSGFHRLPNGYARCVENGVASLDLSDDEDRQSDGGEEEETEREASDSAILRAFREDESRRNAPLPAENAMRVMDAMRGVSFGGLVPDWADQVSEDQWVNRLRRLRESPPAAIQD